VVDDETSERKNLKRDFSLRRPTRSQEANVKDKASACFARNDGWVLGAD
jgi:hypothetical protein